MTEKDGCSSIFQTPSSSRYYDIKQDEGVVSNLFLILLHQKYERDFNIGHLHIGVNSLAATDIECLLHNTSTGMPALEEVVHDSVQPLQLAKKEQYGVKLPKRPSQTSNQMKKKQKT